MTPLAGQALLRAGEEPLGQRSVLGKVGGAPGIPSASPFTLPSRDQGTPAGHPFS